jgi:hypothetical protein
MGDSMSTIINATTTNGVVIQPDNSGSLQLATNSGTTAITIDTSQKVGIGTTSPSYKLHVQMPSDGSAGVGFRYIGGTNNPGLFFNVNESTRVSSINASGSTSGILALQTDNVERMRIDSSGNLLVNATAQLAGEKFNVSAGGSTINTAYFNFTTTDDRGNVILKHARATGATTGQQIAFLNSSGTNVGAVNSTTSATSYATSSDYRLKENVQPMVGALDKVAQLKPVTYTWKIDGKDGQGFIAHELQEVIPDCVSGQKDAVETYTDEDGIEQTRIKPQGIDTSFLVATLTAAIQEQQTIINNLKARIETLEAK